MANKEHEQFIGQPPSLVEGWRRANPGTQIDLSGLEISRQRFDRWNLSGANLSGATFLNCHFDEADLSDANLAGTSFNQSVLTKCRLDRANLAGAKFNNANLASATIANVDAAGVDFTAADLQGTMFTNASLLGAIFENSKLTRTKFVDTDISGANLQGAHIHDVDLAGHSFEGADLSRTHFQQMNFSNLIFTGAILENGALANSNLKNANLDRAILKNTNISGTTFQDASLISASLRGANANQTIFSGANLHLADFYEAELSHANFEHAEGLTTAKNLQTARLNTASDVRYFDTIKIPLIDRLFSWERIRTVGRLPLFAASYTALIAIPFLFYFLDAYNKRVDLARAWAETIASGLEHNSTYAWLAKAILNYAHHEPVPTLSFWLLISTVVLGIGATIYSFACPPRVRSFSREEWNDQLGRSLIHYWPLAWWYRPLRLICVSCYLFGGLGVFVVLVSKIYNVFEFILTNS